MLEGSRFALYRNALALATLASFRSQRVAPVRPPDDWTYSYRAFGDAYPDMPIEGLVDPDGFPDTDRQRLLRIAASRRLLGLLQRVAPERTPPVPSDHDEYLAAVYPAPLRRAWPTPPRIPPGVHAALDAQEPDLLARLAVDGPFASYLRAVETGGYTIDLEWMLPYRPRPGLLAPGGRVDFAVQDGGLRTVRLVRDGHTTGAGPLRDGCTERSAFLAGLNEDLTTFRHNVTVHLATLTPFALATSNRLPTDHPVRRLLHHCFHTVLVGNREVGELQLSGPDGFSSRVFSHDHTEVARMATDRLAGFDVWDLVPDEQFARRGTTLTPFPYPYRDNVLQLWGATRAYVDAYLDLYLDDDAMGTDDQLRAWWAELDRLLPNGLGPQGQRPTRSSLSRLCAMLIHVSTVEHDYLNNVSWDFSTLGWLVPGVAPASGERMDQRRAFELITTLIVTWKPYNMLLTSDIPSLAPDERGRQVMSSWLDDLRRIQQAMQEQGADASLSYPANLNVSISN